MSHDSKHAHTALDHRCNGIFSAFVFIFISRSVGISSLSTLTDPDRMPDNLPELPAGEEKRLQRAALHLQQKLILRQWLKDNRLEHLYTR